MLQEHSWAVIVPEIMSLCPRVMEGLLAHLETFQSVWVPWLCCRDITPVCALTQEGATGPFEHFFHFSKLSDGSCAASRGHTASRETDRLRFAVVVTAVGEFRSLWDLSPGGK